MILSHRCIGTGARLLLTFALAAMAQCGPVHFGRASLAPSSQAAAPSAPEPRALLVADAAPSTPASAPLPCAAGALTCVHIERPQGARGAFPTTFGLPFPPGAVPAGSTLTGRTSGGATIPVQMDEPATYGDRSLRFAVLSMMVPDLPSDGIVSLFVQGNGGSGAPMPAATYLASGHDVRVVLNLYSAQVSTLKLGNRRGWDPGTPFNVGETVTVRLGSDPVDTYTVIVTEKTAGGGFGTIMPLTNELMAAINKGPHFHAYNQDELVFVTTNDEHAPPFAVKIETNSAAPVETGTIQAGEPPRRYVASSHALLDRAQQNGSLQTWLAGPVATDFSISGPMVADDGTPHPRLTARMNIRVFEGVPQVRTDVAVEDLWTYDPGARNWQYDVEITQDGKTVLQQPNVTHYHHARWHKVLWSDGGGTAFVQYDKHYFLNSHAVAHYDETLGIPGAVLADEARQLAKARTGIMGSAFVTQYFGTTGGRSDIGPLPRWTVLYLLSMDPGAYAAMLANADASGSIPIHFRDRKTGRPVSLDDHPGFIPGGWPPAEPPDQLPPMTNGFTPWAPETAHQPSLVYVPYMVTGDQYYLEELQFWADWNLGAVAIGLRHHAEGIVVAQEQLRGQAWSLRSLAEAAAITPDRDPMKPYFTGKLANNIKFALDRYAQRSNPVGLDVVFMPDDHFAPWQLDFMTLTVAQIAQFGYPGAETWLNWLAQLAVGRFNNEANGYCRMNGPAPVMRMRNVQGGPLFTSWREVSTATFPNEKTCPTVFPEYAYDGSTLGYVVNAMATMAVLSDFKATDARSTYDWLNERERRVAFGTDPTWRIVPH